AEMMVVFGAFQNGFDYQHFHVFQWATLLALWGVVISAVYMLRAYRRTFFGSSAEPELVTTDIRSGFRVPIALLVTASLLLGFLLRRRDLSLFQANRPRHHCRRDRDDARFRSTPIERSSRCQSAIRTRRIFCASTFHLCRTDVDGFGDRFRLDLCFA